MHELVELKGIGPKCVQLLNAIGIETEAQFRELGAMEAYLRIIETTDFKANISLLYAFVGALEDRNWLEVAKQDKARLKAELEAMKEIGVINCNI